MSYKQNELKIYTRKKNKNIKDLNLDQKNSVISDHLISDKPKNSNEIKQYKRRGKRKTNSIRTDLVEGISKNAPDLNNCVISSDLIGKRDGNIEIVPVSLKGKLGFCKRKKLLVLDLNGLLVDIAQESKLINSRIPDTKIKGRPVFKRPFCDDFIRFCFENFKIGIWSSRKKYNVDRAVDFLMGDIKHDLLFCWDQSKCTETGFRTKENMHKPLVLKELKKLWDKEESDLPWEMGEYTVSNTLLLDDSPYKALCNPPYTAIFPHPYNFENLGDNSLGPGGEIRVYLGRLALADDVQCFVRENPFGQPAITDAHPLWHFYIQIIHKFNNPLVQCNL